MRATRLTAALLGAAFVTISARYLSSSNSETANQAPFSNCNTPPGV